MQSPQLTGSIVAIVTPMQAGGALDLPALARLIEFHIAEGTAGIVIVGTTGESPTVDFDEHCRLIKTAVETVRGRIPVIAGTGANSTTEAIELTAYAKKAGATSCLSVVPYYNKPTQEGLYRHFRTIAEARRPAAHPLQRARAHGRRSRDRHRAAPGRGAGHRRHQGRDLRHDARTSSSSGACPPSASSRLYSGNDDTALPLHPARRPRRHLGHRQRRAAADGRHVPAALAGDIAAARRFNDRLMPLNTQALRRSQSDPRQVGAGGDGPHSTRAAPAAGAAVGAASRDGPCRAARVGRARLILEGTPHGSPEAAVAPRESRCSPRAVLVLGGCESMSSVDGQEDRLQVDDDRPGARAAAGPARRRSTTSATTSPRLGRGRAPATPQRPKTADQIAPNQTRRTRASCAAATDRWLVVKATPEQAWSTVRQFWIDTGFVARRRAAAGRA